MSAGQEKDQSAQWEALWKVGQGIKRAGGAQCETLGQERWGECGGLDENVPHKLTCLQTQSSVGGSVWVGLGGFVLMEE